MIIKLKLILAMVMVVTPTVLLAAGSSPSTTQEAGTTLSFYTPITPTRICDTRPGNPSNLVGQQAQCNNRPINAPDTLTVQVAGIAGIPLTATAVVLNVTEIGDITPGYLTVYPAGGTRPLVSNLNWAQAETLAGNVTVGLSSTGAVDVYVSGGTANVVVDVEGYFSGSGVGFYPSSPVRICDTRQGNPSNLSGQQAQCNGRPLAPAVGYPVQVTGIAGIPLTATAAVVNITKITSVTPTSYLDVYPAGGSRPTASAVNWIPGRTVANQAVVKLSAGGQIELYDPTAANVIVDVEGWFAPGGAGFVPITPTRITDTRWGSALPGEGQTLSNGHPYRVKVANAMADRVPTSAVAAALNVTAADGTVAGYMTAYPGGSRPTASTVNWTPGGASADASYSALANGAFSLVASGPVDAVVDVEGYFTNTTAPSLVATSVPTIVDSGFNASTLGVAVQTDPLTATASTWSMTPTSLSYQWFFCTPGCAPIPGGVGDAPSSGTTTLSAIYIAAKRNAATSAPDGGATTGTVNDTTTTVTCSPNPSLYGQSVTCAVSVSNGTSTPVSQYDTGSVTISASSGQSCKATLTDGTGQCSLTGLPVGTITATADYPGGTNNAPSSGSTIITVFRNPTATAVSCSPNPAVLGQTVVCAVTVSNDKATAPTGVVTITSSGQSCEAILSSGNGQCSLTGLSAGGITATADYPGDTNDAPSSGSTTGMESRNPTATTVTCSPNVFMRGDTITCTATVVSQALPTAVPVGTVTISASSGQSCEAALADGTGQCSLVGLPAEKITVTASYSGDSGNAYTITQAVPNQASIYVQSVAINGTSAATVDSAPLPVEHEWASYSTRMYDNNNLLNPFSTLLPPRNLPMAQQYSNYSCMNPDMSESYTSSPSCTQTMMATWNADRRIMSAPPALLPSNWFSLTRAEQFWVAMNLDRSERGISIDPVLTNTIPCVTQAAQQNIDASCGDMSGANNTGSGSLENLISYLYDDGCGPMVVPMGRNADCPKGYQDNMLGWGHRDSMLEPIVPNFGAPLAYNATISDFNGEINYIAVSFVNSSKAGATIADQNIAGWGFNTDPSYENGAWTPGLSSSSVGSPVPDPLVNMTWSQVINYLPPCERYGDICTVNFANAWNSQIINEAATSGS